MGTGEWLVSCWLYMELADKCNWEEEEGQNYRVPPMSICLWFDPRLET